MKKAAAYWTPQRGKKISNFRQWAGWFVLLVAAKASSCPNYWIGPILAVAKAIIAGDIFDSINKQNKKRPL